MSEIQQLDPGPLTKQEMFDRAVRGLHSQGWTRCTDSVGNCIYNDGTGKHCAWGWVDTSLGVGDGATMSVGNLRNDRIGLTAGLTSHDLDFAARLQDRHDFGPAGGMDLAFARLAREYGLTWPSDVPHPDATSGTP